MPRDVYLVREEYLRSFTELLHLQLMLSRTRMNENNMELFEWKCNYGIFLISFTLFAYRQSTSRGNKELKSEYPDHFGYLLLRDTSLSNYYLVLYLQFLFQFQYGIHMLLIPCFALSLSCVCELVFSKKQVKICQLVALLHNFTFAISLW